MLAADSIKDQANELFKGGDYVQAIKLYSEAIELEPKPTYYANRAAAYLQAGDFRLGFQDCIRAIQLDPKFTKAYFRAAKCQLYLGNLDDALEQLKNAEKHSSKSITDQHTAVQQEMAVIHTIQKHIKAYHDDLANDKMASALHHIERAMTVVDPSLSGTGLDSSVSEIDTARLDKLPVKWRIWRGEALIGCGDIDEACQQSMAILRKDNRQPDALYLRAKAMHLLDSHPTTTVMQYLQQCLAFDPDHKKAFSLRKHIKNLENIKNEGNDCFKQGNYDDALTAYQKYLDQDTNGAIIRAKVFSNRATVYSKLSLWEECLSDCQSSLDILDKTCFPTVKEDISGEDRKMSNQSQLYLKVYLRQADALMKSEKYEEAVRAYEMASTIKPEDREIKSAIRNAKKALEISKRKDYYKILGLQRSASDSEIKKAYRKMALLHHPDKQVGLSDQEREVAETKFKECQEAYEVLSDPRKKQLFDAGHNVDGSSASAGGPSMDDIFAQFGQSRGGFSQFGGSPFGGSHFGGSSFGNGFSQFADEDDFDPFQQRGHSGHYHRW